MWIWEVFCKESNEFHFWQKSNNFALYKATRSLFPLHLSYKFGKCSLQGK